jgi:hypothetical protein
MIYKPYSDDEVAILKQMRKDLYSNSEIGRRLNRSASSISQKAAALGLEEIDLSMLHLIRNRGREVLKVGKDPDKIKLKTIYDRVKAKKVASNAKRIQQALAIKKMKATIAAGANRDEAMMTAWSDGATLQQIGKALGMTKQGAGIAISRFKDEIIRHQSAD